MNMRRAWYQSVGCWLVIIGTLPTIAAEPGRADSRVQAPPVTAPNTAQAQIEKQGPLMTDQELFEAIDLTGKGLEAVKAAVGAGDLSGAKRALAAYLRARTTVPWWFDAHHPARDTKYSKQDADNTVAGKVQVVTIGYTFPQGNIDWFYNVTTARADLPDNAEWQWQLNRMDFWPNLGRAYWGTGDELYAQTWVKQLRSWVEHCPHPPKGSDQKAGSAWRTIETGIRMSGSWPDAYHRFLTSPAFTDDDIVLYLKSCIEQARYLRQYPTTGNWLTMEMSGLYTVGGLFPELKEAKDWRSYASGSLYAELNKQFLPDGAQVELTPGYHQVALDNILKIPALAQLFGRMNELPGDYVARTQSAFDYNLYLMTPDRNLPRFNDSWPVGVPQTLARASTLFPQRRDFAWIATNGQSGEPPAQTSHPFPYAGYFVMRSGWQPDANYLCFDAGPLGYGHVHQDKLNVVLWAYGREILFDGGGGSYEQSKWRSYATDTYSHNTVLVDNLPQRRQTKDREANVSRQPIDVHWTSTPIYDFAAGVYDDGYGKEDNRIVTHTRRVLFVKPDLFLVADTLTPKDNAPHTYQVRWHLLPTATKTDDANGMVTTADAGQSNLAVVPLLHDGLTVRTASAQTTPELLGWWVRKDMEPQYVPATTVLHTRQGTGVQQFLTLLVPLKPGAVNPVQHVTVLEPGKIAIDFADRPRQLVTYDLNPLGGMNIGRIPNP
ncbi:MAG: alginate lyase family protein [Abitibacteriaceae bacterium]|nr:alginate lyase family protein [Abditibacteriaceae bacterium]